MSVGRARAFAGSHGIRLATPREGSRAARSKEGVHHPSGDEDTGLAPKAVLERVDRGARTAARESEAYLRFAAPIGATPGDRSMEGVQDTPGNVREWVKGAPVAASDGGSGVLAGHAMAKSAAFDDQPPQA